MTVRAAVGKLWPSLKLVSMATNWIKMQSQCVHIMCVTLFPILKGGPMIWIYRLLVTILSACVSHPLKCNRNSCCMQAVDNQNGWIDKLSEYGVTREVSQPICTWWWYLLCNNNWTMFSIFCFGISFDRRVFPRFTVISISSLNQSAFVHHHRNTVSHSY